MSEPARPASEARLANVSAALLLGDPTPDDDARARRAAEQLAGLFREVLLVGGNPPPGAPGRAVGGARGAASELERLAPALEAAGEERVLVVHAELPQVSAELLLALTAWPEHAIVAPRRAGRAELRCAIHRRDDVLEQARRLLEEGRGTLADLAAACDCGYLENADLAALEPEDGARGASRRADERA